MPLAQVSERRWIVVRVWRGIPVGIEAYRNQGAAERRERSLRKSMSPEDEVAVFEIDLSGDRALSA